MRITKISNPDKLAIMCLEGSVGNKSLRVRRGWSVVCAKCGKELYYFGLYGTEKNYVKEVFYVDEENNVYCQYCVVRK